MTAEGVFVHWVGAYVLQAARVVDDYRGRVVALRVQLEVAARRRRYVVDINFAARRVHRQIVDRQGAFRFVVDCKFFSGVGVQCAVARQIRRVDVDIAARQFDFRQFHGGDLNFIVDNVLVGAAYLFRKTVSRHNLFHAGYLIVKRRVFGGTRRVGLQVAQCLVVVVRNGFVIVAVALNFIFDGSKCAFRHVDAVRIVDVDGVGAIEFVFGTRYAQSRKAACNIRYRVIL